MIFIYFLFIKDLYINVHSKHTYATIVSTPHPPSMASLLYTLDNQHVAGPDLNRPGQTRHAFAPTHQADDLDITLGGSFIKIPNLHANKPRSIGHIQFSNVICKFEKILCRIGWRSGNVWD